MTLFVVALTILLVFSIIIYSAYKLQMYHWKLRLVIWFITSLTLIICLFISSYMIEDYLFFKSDAIEMLNKHHIILKDDFEIKSHEIIGLIDFYQTFDLEISLNDRNRLIDDIINSVHYQNNIPEMFDIRSGKPRYSDTNRCYYITYKGGLNYTYEAYKLNKTGYTPTWDIITLSKEYNILTFQRILD